MSNVFIEEIRNESISLSGNKTRSLILILLKQSEKLFIELPAV